MNKQAAFEVIADGPDVSASIFASSGKEARHIFWELLNEHQNGTASLEVVWDYADGVHPFCRVPN